MPNMVEVGLTGLTHILHGGVRIRKNPKLCYVQTIDWKRIVSKPYHGMIMISVRIFFFHRHHLKQFML